MMSMKDALPHHKASKSQRMELTLRAWRGANVSSLEKGIRLEWEHRAIIIDHASNSPVPVAAHQRQGCPEPGNPLHWSLGIYVCPVISGGIACSIDSDRFWPPSCSYGPFPVVAVQINGTIGTKSCLQLPSNKMCNPDFLSIADGTKVKPVGSISLGGAWFAIGFFVALSLFIICDSVRDVHPWYHLLPAFITSVSMLLASICLARWMRNHKLYSAFRITDEDFQYWNWRNQLAVVNYNEIQEISIIQFAPCFIRMDYQRNDVNHILKIWFIDSWDKEVLNKVISIICERATLSKADHYHFWEFVSGNIDRYKK
jgi:hypothetical protein